MIYANPRDLHFVKFYQLNMHKLDAFYNIEKCCKTVMGIHSKILLLLEKAGKPSALNAASKFTIELYSTTNKITDNLNSLGSNINREIILKVSYHLVKLYLSSMSFELPTKQGCGWL